MLASNTSGLSITAIASRCARPERVLTTHFWNPPHLIPLVEIVKGEKTSDDAAQAVRALLAGCGKTPVIVNKDRPGQLGNRLQMALVREAANIVAEGIASAEDVDTVARNSFGIRLPAYGILEHQDMVGLDMCVGILDYVASDLNGEPRAPEYYRELVRSRQPGSQDRPGILRLVGEERGRGEGAAGRVCDPGAALAEKRDRGAGIRDRGGQPSGVKREHARSRSGRRTENRESLALGHLAPDRAKPNPTPATRPLRKSLAPRYRLNCRCRNRWLVSSHHCRA